MTQKSSGHHNLSAVDEPQPQAKHVLSRATYLLICTYMYVSVDMNDTSSCCFCPHFTSDRGEDCPPLPCPALPFQTLTWPANDRSRPSSVSANDRDRDEYSSICLVVHQRREGAQLVRLPNGDKEVMGSTLTF